MDDKDNDNWQSMEELMTLWMLKLEELYQNETLRIIGERSEGGTSHD